MNSLVKMDNVATMDSNDLLEIINNARREFEEKEIRRNDFVNRIKDELDGEHYESFVVQNLNNTSSVVVKLTKDQAMLVSMRESKGVRRKVLEKLKAMEEQATKPLSQIELIAASAQALVEMERRQIEQEKNLQLVASSVQSLQKEVEEIAESHVWDHCPPNYMPITKIRVKINERYGLPAWVVDCVMKQLPLSPKIAGMVRNSNENASGAHYAVWAVTDVTRVFQQFVKECEMVSDCFATHPFVDNKFKLVK